MATKAITKYRYRNRFASRRTHSRRKFSLPLAIIGGFMPTAYGVWERRTNPTAMAQYLQMGFTGLMPDGTWQPGMLKYGAIPLALGCGIHWLAGVLGINRAIARTGIPILRI